MGNGYPLHYLYIHCTMYIQSLNSLMYNVQCTLYIVHDELKLLALNIESALCCIDMLYIYIYMCVCAVCVVCV